MPDIGRVMMTCVDEDQEFLCDLIGLLSNLTFGQPVRKAKGANNDECYDMNVNGQFFPLQKVLNVPRI